LSGLEDLFHGLVFYGTGGGGRAEIGIAMLEAHFGPGWVPHFTDPDTLAADTIAAATIVIGGRDPAENFSSQDRERLDLPGTDMPIEDRFTLSVTNLSGQLKRPIGALAVVELGSIAMAATLIAAERLSLPVLDCDCTGRSIPELGLTKMDLVDLPVSPISLVDRFGGKTTISGPVGSFMADRMARQISRAVLGRGLATVCYPAPIARFSEGLVKGSVAKAWLVGSIVGGAQGSEKRLQALACETGGHIVCRARVRQTVWRSLEPYSFREFDYLLDGADDVSKGSRIRIFVKNEHHAVWIDDRLVASSPDVIAVLHTETLRPLTTLGDATDGLDVVVFAAPALDDRWREAAGRALLGPRRFGIDEEPILIAAPSTIL
jgi:DUF917 family protein